MEIKKLVLGACVLAAVIGAAPQVFAWQRGTPVFGCEQGSTDETRQMIEAGQERRRVRDLLSMDDERQMALTEIVDLTREKLEGETRGLKEMGERELFFVKQALGAELRGYFIYQVGRHDYDAVAAKVNAIESSMAESRSSVSAAEERHKEGHLSGFGLFLAKRWSAVKVWALKLKLGMAVKHQNRMRAQFDYGQAVRTRILGFARQCRTKARELRAQRIACLRELNDAWIRRFGQKSDIEKLENLNGIDVSTIELEDIMVRGLQGASILRDETSRYKNEQHIITGIADALEHQHRRGWLECAFEDRLDLCRELVYLFQPEKLDYDHSMAPFVEQRILLESDDAVGQSGKLLRLAENALMKTRVS